MSALAPADTQKLVKFLGMLGSDHPGERAAAGLKAHQLVSARNLTWGDVVAPAAIAGPHHREAVGHHQARAAFLLACGYPWNDWEERFLDSMTCWAGSPTYKQSVRLRVLDQKAEAWLARGGSE